jgi:hypothetical protein
VAATPLDLWYRFDIGPAFITAIDYDEGKPRLLAVNRTAGRSPDQIYRAIVKSR